MTFDAKIAYLNILRYSVERTSFSSPVQSACLDVEDDGEMIEAEGGDETETLRGQGGGGREGVGETRSIGLRRDQVLPRMFISR